jgi:hypothetical protein
MEESPAPSAPASHIAVYWLAAAALFGLARFSLFREASGLSALAAAAVKAAVWLLPAWLYAAYTLKTSPTEALGLRPRVALRGAWPALLAALGYLALTFGLGAALAEQPLRSPLASAPGLIALLADGAVEEAAFRGALLGQVSRRLSFGRANLLCAALFVLPHWPVWLASGQAAALVPASVSLGALALLLGWVTRRTGSIWLAVLLHALNNLGADAVS